MKARFTLKSLLVGIVFFSPFLVSSQNANDTITQVGGVDDYSDSQKEKLEDATLRVWYEFTQQAEYKDSLINRIDTMALVLGSTYSVYYDWNKKRKAKEMDAQFSGIDFQSIHYTNFEGFEQRATEDDKLIELGNNTMDKSEILKNRKLGLISTSDLDNIDLMNYNCYLLEEEIPSQEWQLHEEQQELLGYICNKATCTFRGRNYIAWYTIDIPINDGPYKFYGLPGLILMIEDSENIFQFKAVGLEQLTKVELVTENKDEFIKCTLEQYRKVKKRMQETLFFYYPVSTTLFANKRHAPWPFNSIEID